MKRILLIAGTVEARQLADRLVAAGHAVLATVATSLGAQLLSNPAVTVEEGRKDSRQLAELLRQYDPDYLVDASHPFAQAVSQNALTACAETGVPYVRLERANLNSSQVGVHRVDSYREAALLADRIAAVRGGKVLLTVGSSQLETFVRLIPDAGQRLFARVLPLSGVLQKCEQLGLAAGNILAAQGPFSQAMNLEIIRHCGAGVLVSKDSGEPGGLEQKLAACAEAGIDLVLIRRPQLAYPLQFGDLDALVAYLER